MTATWNAVFGLDVPEPPACLTITAWGRRFRLVPSRASTYAEVFPSDVVRVEVVGPDVAPRLGTSAPKDVIHVDFTEDVNNDITRLGDAPGNVLELVYEVAAEGEGDITAVSPNPMLERASADTRRTRRTESRHG
jgi:hypothetical protein